MPDQFDQASEVEQLLRDAALKNAKNKPAGPVATGECLFCQEPVLSPNRWCDAYCRDDWQKENPGK